MRIEHEAKDFYAVYEVDDVARAYLRHSVPNLYRRFESTPRPRWLVHRKYLSSLRELTSSGPPRDAYATLFLTKNAPGFMIDAAWKALAKHYHPDRGGNPEDFKRVKEAYEELNERNNDGGSA